MVLSPGVYLGTPYKSTPIGELTSNLRPEPIISKYTLLQLHASNYNSSKDLRLTPILRLIVVALVL